MPIARREGIAGFLAALALAVSTPCFGQPNLLAGGEGDGPRAAVQHFLTLNAASALDGPEGRALLAGELDNAHPPTFGPLSPPDRIVMLIGGTAVARLPAQGEDRPDLYLYLSQRDGAWTIDALRTLALTGIPRELRRMLRSQGFPHVAGRRHARQRGAHADFRPGSSRLVRP
jgi:hypothetical protein